MVRARVVGRVRIGSLFSGIGGLDLACERVFGGSTLWQVEIDPYCRAVLAARWPRAQRFDDVRAVSAAELAPVDVLCAGSPCQDLSVMGSHAGLDGARSGLYSEIVRIAAELSPRYVVIENVAKLLHYRQRVERDFAATGYGLIWQVCEASDVGAPHKRRRVFALAVRGAEGSIVLPRPSPQRDLFAPRWQGGDADQLWPTLCSDTRSTRAAMFKQGGEPLGHAVRWPTGRTDERPPGVVNPAWCALLMGYPAGWTDPTATPGAHAWPLGRGAAQAPHEPPRLVAEGSVRHRAERLQALGNAVVPQQAAAALARMVEVAT